MPSNLVKTRQFLGFVLRHKPQAIGLTLDAQGWANLDELIRLAQIKDKPLTRYLVEEVVARNDKQRFVLNASGARKRGMSSCRASRNHLSVFSLRSRRWMCPQIF